MEAFNPTHGRAITEKLLAWFALNQRPLPWRVDYAPYAVWISEMMLQQTQMERGVSYFLRWMQRFPSVSAVAEAAEEDILHAWEGLGYYRRARYIHAAAKDIVLRFGAHVPCSRADLESLPGLGPYTVAAIMGIAYNEDVPCIDANVERVLSRLYNIDSPPKKGVAACRIAALSQALLPSGQARQYNQAMMEFGALVCSKKPACTACPLAEHCQARQMGLEQQRPVLEQKPAVIPVEAAYGVMLVKGAVFLQKRPMDGLWGGLWQFPDLEHFTGAGAEKGKLLGQYRHSYTNHRLAARFFEIKPADALLPSLLAGVQAHTLSHATQLAMPAHHRKMMDKLQAGQQQFFLL